MPAPFVLVLTLVAPNPLIVAGSGIAESGTADALVEMIDLPATTDPELSRRAGTPPRRR